MPAHRKPVALHKLEGTYQPCRHAGREQQAKRNSTGPVPKCPSELTEEAKRVWRRLIKTLPGLSELDAPILAQVSTLYSQFLSGPERFTAADHTQLRLLVIELKKIEALPEEVAPVKDEVQEWMDRREALKNKHPCIR